MVLIQKIVGSLWTAFAVFALCLGLLVDFPNGRDKLEDSVSAVLPVAAALLPYIAMVGSIVGGGRIVIWASMLGIDRLNQGPSRRAFIVLNADIRLTKELLISQSNNHLLFLSDKAAAYSNYCKVVAQLDNLRTKLVKLEIEIGIIDVEREDQRLQMIGMLSSLEVHAVQGDIEKARIAIEKGRQEITDMRLQGADKKSSPC